MTIRLENISVGYSTPLIENGNASLSEGEIGLLLGKNGSGKTTLLKSILGLIPSISGNILIENKDLNAYTRKDLSKKMAVVFSSLGHQFRINSREFIEHGRYPYLQLPLRISQKEEDLLHETSAFLGIDDVLETPVSELSDGNFQKVSIARAIVQDTDIIVLDEPLSHLDSSNQMLTLDILQKLAKEKNKTILFTSHDWNQSVQIANKLWLIKDQHLYAGNTEDIALKEDLIDYFSEDNYYFDYCYNQFRRKENAPNLKVRVNLNNQEGKRVFWLYKALSKNNVDIEEKADTEIEIQSNVYVLKKKGRTEEFTSIEDLIVELQ